MKEFADLDYLELDSLTKEDKQKYLEKEFEISGINTSLLFDLDILEENKVINLLESVMNAKSSREVTQGGVYPAKLVYDIFTYSKIEESEFYNYLKILYLNGFIEYLTLEDFDIELESRKVSFENINFIDPTQQFRYNLHRLYRTDKDLFNEEVYTGLQSLNSEEEMYYRFLNRGGLVEIICSYKPLIRLSNKGMHYLHFVTSKRSLEIMEKQEEILGNIKNTKSEQEELLQTFEENKNEQVKNIKSINISIKKYEKKIKAFYKDITTILSIMVAAFAVIGVNISAIPKIESNFTANVLALNLSLIVVLLALFYILKVLVYGDSINLKRFYSLLTFCVLGIISIFLFLGFYHESKIDVIEKKYEEKISDYTNENGKKILELQKQLQQLEKSIE